MKLLSFLFCDDVRKEDNEKIMLIGIYDLRIIINEDVKFPVQLPTAAIFCRFQLENGDKPFDTTEFNVSIDDVAIATGSLPAVVEDFTKPISLAYKIIPLPLPKEGRMKFEIFLKANNEVVGTIKPDSIFVQKRVAV